VSKVEFRDESTSSIQKVIPMKNKAYRALNVNTINLTVLQQHRREALVHARLDVGKDTILCTLRWGTHDFQRPWRVRNPADRTRRTALLQISGQGRLLMWALEPTGTYGGACGNTCHRPA
jgi:hypothetical protein